MLGVLYADISSYNRPVEKLRAPPPPVSDASTASSSSAPSSPLKGGEQEDAARRTASRITNHPTVPGTFGDNRVRFFRRLHAFFPQLAFLLAYASLCLFDTLIDTLLAPVKMVWSRFAMRETFASFLVGCGLVCLVCAAPSESRLYSAVYHFIRASSMLKLYVVFNMLELADKVLSSFSTDIVEAAIAHLDSWFHPNSERNINSTRSGKWEVVLTVAVSGVSVVCHTVVLLMHIATLNVAINSEDSSLVGLLISNNFVELKSIIFKKYTPESLFTVVCADALEWVQSVVFIAVMFLQHLQTEGLGSLVLFDIVMIVGCEMVIDALKHMFASRYNSISLIAYQGYIESLMLDVALRRFLGELNLPIFSTEAKNGKKLSTTTTAGYCRTTDLVPNPARRAAFSPFPYASIILWAAWPVVRVLWSLSPLNVGLLVIVCVLVKILIVSATTGIATRYVCRTLMHRIPTPTGLKNSESANTGVMAPSPSTSALSTNPLLMSLSTSRAVTPVAPPSPSATTAGNIFLSDNNNTDYPSSSSSSPRRPLGIVGGAIRTRTSSFPRQDHNDPTAIPNNTAATERSISRDISQHSAGAIGISPPAFCSTPHLAPGWASSTNLFLSSTGGFARNSRNDPSTLSPYRPITPPHHHQQQRQQRHQQPIPIMTESDDATRVTPTAAAASSSAATAPPSSSPTSSSSLVIVLDPFVDALLTVDRFNLNAGKKK